jgi:hypothetical protein
MTVDIFGGPIRSPRRFSTRLVPGSLPPNLSLPSPLISNGDRRVVANTRGLGVRFRQESQQDAPSSIAIPEGTVVYVIEQLLAPDGEVWRKVRLDDGSLGYIKDRYLAD